MAQTDSSRPNILYVFSDQQRASAMGCYYGDEQLRTPQFDVLAGEGMRLDAAVSSTPVCTPYRAMLMTGLFGHHTGVTTNRHYPDLSGYAHIGKSFQSAGYRCGYIGKWHLGEMPLDAGNPLRLGFDDEWFIKTDGAHSYYEWVYATDSQNTVEGEGFYCSQVETDRAIEYIQRQDGEAPWCLFMSWGPPHPPLLAPEPYAKPYLEMDLTHHPNTSKIIGEQMQKGVDDGYAHYYGMTEGLDIEWGRLMEALEESGQADNTIVMYTSDHGEMLGSQGLRGKRWPYRESTQVPFLIRWPGKVAAGSSLSMPFGTPDVFPTLCGLAGLDVPAGLDGRDFSGAIQGRSDAPTQEYAYTTMHHAFVPWPGWRGVRTERYNYARLESGSWVLFDLENDPYEEHNLVGENPGLVADMEGLLQEAMAANGDSWRGTPQECGDWEQWLGNKQIQQQGPDAVYPGSKVAQKGTGSGRDL